jgi:O-antigen ligase
VAHWFLIILLLLWGVVLSDRILLLSLLSSTWILASVLGFTVFYEGDGYSWGALLPLVGYLLAMAWSPTAAAPIKPRLFVFLTIIVASLGVGPFLYREALGFLAFFYSSGWQGLVESMVAREKPVSVFGTHSVAAFFYIIFFVVYLEFYRQSGAKVWLLMAALFYLLALSLNSTTAYGLCSIGLMLFLLYVTHRWSLRDRAVLFMGIGLAIIPIILVGFETFAYLLGKGSANGIFARYGEDGVLVGALSRIEASPFLGIGLGHSNEYYYTDSGYVNVALRLGFLGAALWFGMFLYWMWKIRSSPEFKIGIVVTVLAFAFGYPILQLDRWVALLPVIAAVVSSGWRGLDSTPKRQSDLPMRPRRAGWYEE